MKVTALTLILVVVQLAYVLGQTSYSPIVKVKEYGKTVRYCQYNDVKMLPRSKFKDYPSCMVCKCRRSGLSCARMASAPMISVPDNSICISVIVGCKARFVYRENTSKLCAEEDKPTEMSAVLK